MTLDPAPASFTVDIPGLTVAGLAFGPAEGPPVLAVHGWLDNAASFGPLASRLPHLRIYAVDLPGHGRSGHRPPGANHSFIDWIPDVAQVAQGLGLQRFALLGHSMGAAIAALTAAALPDRVHTLVMIEGAGPMSEDPSEAAKTLRQAVTQRLAPQREPSGKVWASREDAAQRRMGATTPMRIESALALIDRQLDPHPEGGFTLRYDPRLRLGSLLRLSEPQVMAYLRAVACPTRVVMADQGWPFDPEALQRRLDALTHATLRRVPGGHHVHMDDPDVVADAIRDHLPAASEGSP